MFAKLALLVAALSGAASTAMAAPAALDKPNAKDESAFNQCLAGGNEQAIQCVSVVQGPCLKTDAGQSTAGMIDCTHREMALWAARASDTTHALYGIMRPQQKPYFDAAEQAWLTYRDKICAADASLYVDGSLYGVLFADCALRQTAERALHLERQLKNIKQELE